MTTLKSPVSVVSTTCILTVRPAPWLYEIAKNQAEEGVWFEIFEYSDQVINEATYDDETMEISFQVTLPDEVPYTRNSNAMVTLNPKTIIPYCDYEDGEFVVKLDDKHNQFSFRSMGKSHYRITECELDHHLNQLFIDNPARDDMVLSFVKEPMAIKKYNLFITSNDRRKDCIAKIVDLNILPVYIAVDSANQEKVLDQLNMARQELKWPEEDVVVSNSVITRLLHPEAISRNAIVILIISSRSMYLFNDIDGRYCFYYDEESEAFSRSSLSYQNDNDLEVFPKTAVELVNHLATQHWALSLHTEF